MTQGIKENTLYMRYSLVTFPRNAFDVCPDERGNGSMSVKLDAIFPFVAIQKNPAVKVTNSRLVKFITKAARPEDIGAVATWLQDTYKEAAAHIPNVLSAAYKALGYTATDSTKTAVPSGKRDIWHIWSKNANNAEEAVLVSGTLYSKYDVGLRKDNAFYYLDDIATGKRLVLCEYSTRKAAIADIIKHATRRDEFRAQNTEHYNELVKKFTALKLGARASTDDASDDSATSDTTNNNTDSRNAAESDDNMTANTNTTNTTMNFDAIFAGIYTLDELKKEYRRLALICHPDVGGDDVTMQRLNNAYETHFKRIQTGNTQGAATAGGRAADYDKWAQAESAKDYINIISVLIKCKGLTVELCGSWLWIGGDTLKNKEALKAAGCRWSKNKNMWYWRPFWAPSSNRGRASIDDIRTKYGSVNMPKSGSDEQGDSASKRPARIQAKAV